MEFVPGQSNLFIPEGEDGYLTVLYFSDGDE